MRRGFLSPPVIIVLAIITFGVAISLYANSILFNTKKEPTPTNQTPPDVVQQQSDETANWETHRDEKYGWQIMFPEQFECEHPESGAICLEGNNSFEILYGTTRYGAEEEYGFCGKDFSACVNDFIESTSGVLEKKEIAVQGKKGMDFRAKHGNSQVRYFLIENKQGTGVISISQWKFSEKTNKKFDQILSTFKFLE